MKTVKNPQFENLTNVFELGYGKVHLGYFESREEDSVRCGISLQNDTQSYPIGTDTTEIKNIEETECFIFIDNLQGLEVLQERLNRCREFLESKK